MYDDDEDEFDPDEDWPDDSEDAGTTSCPYCGEEIYEDTPRCPHCENYLERGQGSSDRGWKGKPAWFLALGILGVLATILALLL